MFTKSLLSLVTIVSLGLSVSALPTAEVNAREVSTEANEALIKSIADLLAKGYIAGNNALGGIGNGGIKGGFNGLSKEKQRNLCYQTFGGQVTQLSPGSGGSGNIANVVTDPLGGIFTGVVSTIAGSGAIDEIAQNVWSDISYNEKMNLCTPYFHRV